MIVKVLGIRLILITEIIVIVIREIIVIIKIMDRDGRL